MNQNKSKTMDAAEKLMLDLMEKHPGRVRILAAGPFSARSLGASVASHGRQIVIAIHYAKLNTIGKIEVSYGFVRPARSRTFSEGF